MYFYDYNDFELYNEHLNLRDHIACACIMDNPLTQPADRCNTCHSERCGTPRAQLCRVKNMAAAVLVTLQRKGLERWERLDGRAHSVCSICFWGSYNLSEGFCDNLIMDPSNKYEKHV